MAEEYLSELRIPKERVAILIGKKGETKRLLQRKTKTVISVSKEGDVVISGEDNINIYLTSQIIKAIGRGFNPKIAILLLNEKYSLEVIEMKYFTKGSKKKLVRLRSRLIGKEGKARVMLERLTKTHIVVYGKTTAIIGKVTDIMVARNAIEKLLKGSPHGNAYKFIESQKKTQSL